MSADKLAEEQKGRRRRLFGRAPEVEEVAEPVDEEESRGLATPKGRATPSRRRQDDEEEKKKSGIVTRVRTGIGDYIAGVRSELEKVVWPTREEAQRLTIIVLATLVASSIVLGIISVSFTELFTIGLGRPIILFGVIVLAIVIGYFVWRANKQKLASY